MKNDSTQHPPDDFSDNNQLNKSAQENPKPVLLQNFKILSDELPLTLCLNKNRSQNVET